MVWTEGEKKALALDQLGYCAIGLTGTYGAHDVPHRHAGKGWLLHPWLRQHLRVAHREHVIAYDADGASKPEVMQAAQRLAGMLLEAGARSVRMVRIPADGPKGIDDVYAAQGAEAVHGLIRRATPLGPAETRPEVYITTREDEVNAAAIAALTCDENLYQRGRQLVRVLAASQAGESVLDQESPVIAPMPRAVLQERLSAVAAWLTWNARADDWQRAHPPKWSVDAIHARGEWPRIRRLAGIVEQPTLRPDGTILDRPGYDAASGLLYVAPRGVRWPTIAPRPSREDARRALEALEDVVCDFRFAADHHRSAWLALVLTLVARHAIAGPVPLFLFDAPVAGAGKGLGADVACRIGTGRAMPLDGLPRTDEEMDKRILSWALAGRAIVGLDNTTRLDLDSLCRVLTATVVSGRILGNSEDRSAPMRSVFVATGNNVQLAHPDLHRRICPVRLIALEEDPSVRTEFRHPHLIAHVMEQRPSLVCAALTVLRAFIVAGGPKQAVAEWGSYEAWSEIVRGALVWAGRADPATGRDELRSSADEHASLHRALVHGWWQLVRSENRPITAKHAIELVVECRPTPFPGLREVFEALAADHRGDVTAKRLGYVLRKLRQHPFRTSEGLLMLDAAGESGGVNAWTVVNAYGSYGGDGWNAAAAATRERYAPPAATSVACGRRASQLSPRWPHRTGGDPE